MWSAAPGLNWGDGARLQLEAIGGGATYHFIDSVEGLRGSSVIGRLGCTPWDHPPYLLLTHFLAELSTNPLRDLNLLSSACAALALSLLLRAMRGLAPSLGALGAVVMLAGSHTFWFHAATTEVYALHVAFMAWLIGRILRGGPTGAPQTFTYGLTCGLAVANHVMMALTILPSLLFVRWRAMRRRDVILGTAGFVCGLTPWLVAFAGVTRTHGAEIALRSASWFGGLLGLWSNQSVADWLWNPIEYALLLTYQFTPIGVLLAYSGVKRLRNQNETAARYLMLLFVAHALFSTNFPVADRFAFHLPSYCVFSIWIAVGLDGGVSSLHRSRPIVVALLIVGLQISVYAAAPTLARAAGLDEQQLGISVVGSKQRDGMRYYLTPWKRGDDSAERFGAHSLSALERDALVVAPHPDVEAFLVLRCLQLLRDVRTDVVVDPVAFGRPEDSGALVTAAIERARARRPIYLASEAVVQLAPWVREAFHTIPEAGMLRLVRRPGRDSPERSVDPPTSSLRSTLLRAVR